MIWRYIVDIIGNYDKRYDFIPIVKVIREYIRPRECYPSSVFLISVVLPPRGGDIHARLS